MKPLERVLIVKTSSMGDVVHALPMVSDLKRALPELRIDWLVEPSFAALPALHPGVHAVHALPWRRWRKQLKSRATWQAMGALRSELRAQRFDLVIDAQGLVKSMLWARQAGALVAGFDAKSAREPLASWGYGQQHAVPRQAQAVWRCRALAACVLARLGLAPMPDLSRPEALGAPDFGLPTQALGEAPSWWPAHEHWGRRVVLLTSASRLSKRWPQAHWQALAQGLRERGEVPVLVWGAAQELELAQSIASSCGGVVPPFLTVAQCAELLQGALRVVGLDTGFTHLGAAFGVPTLGIYCDHEPGLAGVTGPGPVRSLGGRGQSPSFDAVWRSMLELTGEA